MRAMNDTASTGILAHRRLRREHHGVGAVVDRVGDVADLGARGRRVLDHRLQHLGGGDHESALAARAADDRLLNARHLLERGLDAEIAARHHHAVGDVEDRLDVLPAFGLFDLGDDRDRTAAQPVAQLLHVAGGAHERERDHIDAGRQPEMQIRRSFSVSDGMLTFTPGRLMPL